MKKRGIFIAIEGIEGVGKSLQAKLLHEAIENIWGPCVLTREPGGTMLAEEIRSIVLSSKHGSEMSARTMFALMWAARDDHVAKVVIPAILKGNHVLTDRFDCATYAYQVYGQEGRELKELFFLIRGVYLEKQNACPDLYIVLDMNPQKTLERIAKRDHRQMNHFDKRKLNFHERVREGYLAFTQKIPCIIVNADQGVEKVHADIVSRIKKIGLFD